MGWKYGNVNFVSPNGIFSGKQNLLKGRQKFPNGFSNRKCAVHFLVLNSSGPFGLDRLLSYLPRKSRRNGTRGSP